MLIYGVIFINLACLLYTVAVWAERIQKRLKVWHLIVFWAGFLFDTLGTSYMAKVVDGVFKFNFHGITGLLAIILMLIHSIWASLVIIKKDENMIFNFHKLSFFVWIIWLIPMLSGIIMGMGNMN
jgi:uncharacterized repeat protein (TIGR03987 family)